jgi:cell division protein FtsQ
VLLYGFLFSGDFLIASVVVKGTRLGNPAEVVQAADAIGEPIFSVDASAAAERVAALPYVEHVSVRTRFPDIVTITLIERTPVAVWQTNDGPYLLDSRGHVLAKAEAADLPSVRSDLDAPTVGDTIDSEDVAAVIAVRAAIGDQIAQLRWTAGDGLVANLRNGREVILGDPARMPMKLAVYQSVVGLNQEWGLLDLREPDRPYYK